MPEGVKQVRIDPRTGKLAGASVPGRAEWFLEGTEPTEETRAVDPNDFLLIAKHVVFIQAKFHSINDQLQDEHIPWERVLPVLRRAGYSGYLSSEYEGSR